MEHKLGPIVTAHEAFAVYKDYDGNAPDTHNLVICATMVLAEEVCSWCKEHDHKDTENDDNEETLDEDQEERSGGSFPFVDGWEFSSSYGIRNVVAKPDEISVTFEQAIAVFAD